MLYMRIPITEHMAEKLGYERDDDGFANVDLLLDPSKMGKFVTFVAENVHDCETDLPLIISKENLFDRLRGNDLAQLSAATTPDHYIKMLTRMTRGVKHWRDSTEILLHHDIIEYQWEPLEIPTMTPEIWLMTQCSKIRSIGLCYRVGKATPPESILNSMGMALKNYAIQNELL